MRRSPAKTHAYASYAYEDRSRDADVVTASGMAGLKEFHPHDCVVALRARFNVASQIKHTRKHKPLFGKRSKRTSKWAVRRDPGLEDVDLYCYEVLPRFFVDLEFIGVDQDTESDLDDKICSLQAPPSPTPAPPALTEGQKRAILWREEAQREFEARKKLRTAAQAV